MQTIILAIAYFLQAGKENSQKQVLAYFERTAIGKPDSVFYSRPQRKIGYPDCSIRQFFKIFGFWENSLPACNLGSIPKIIFHFLVAKPSISVLGYVEGYERNSKCFGCETQKSVLGDMERYKKFLKKFESGPSTFQENCPWYSEGKFF